MINLVDLDICTNLGYGANLEISNAHICFVYGVIFIQFVRKGAWGVPITDSPGKKRAFTRDRK